MITPEHCARLVEVARKSGHISSVDAEVTNALKGLTNRNQFDATECNGIFSGTPLEYIFLVPECRRSRLIINLMIIMMRYGFVHPYHRDFCVIGLIDPFIWLQGDASLEHAVLAAYLSVRSTEHGLVAINKQSTSYNLRVFLELTVDIPSRVAIRSFLDDLERSANLPKLVPIGLKSDKISSSVDLPKLVPIGLQTNEDQVDAHFEAMIIRMSIESAADEEQARIQKYYEDQKIAKVATQSDSSFDLYEDD